MVIKTIQHEFYPAVFNMLHQKGAYTYSTVETQKSCICFAVFAVSRKKLLKSCTRTFLL